MSRYCVWVAEKALMTESPAHADRSCRWGISADPEVESSLLPPGASLHLVTPFVPLWLAEAAGKRACSPWRRDDEGASGIGREAVRLWLCRNRARAVLAAWGRGRLPLSALTTVRRAKGAQSSHVPPSTDNVVGALEILRNRQLLENEFAAAWREQRPGVPMPSATDVQHLVVTGVVTRRAGVGLGSFGRWECRRCGSREGITMVWCARCGGECPECQECAGLGVARGCSALYGVASEAVALLAGGSREEPGLDGVRGEVPDSLRLRLPFSLSPAQVAAADEVKKAVHRGLRHVVVWAACGAGKTEVVYGAIQEAVERGERVLLATPRRDVTADLCSRLRGVFGFDLVSGLYGGVEEKYADKPVLVVTTHQALRLSGAFGLVVLDECDAFPYTGSPMLQRAMARLRADAGCFVQMTATPSRKLLGEARARDAHLVYIPARYHGHPLPVPVICPERALAGWQQKLERGGAALLPVPLALERALADTRSEKAQLLVFVPRRAQVQPVVSALAEAGVREVKGVHSRSRTRDTVRQALASGLLEAVVATTVYERGLTFPNVNVVVLFADNMQVFDVATLVQMSGRVGRTMERPDGRVWFLCTRENRCMREAVSSIEKLNEIARERGLLYSCGAE